MKQEKIRSGVRYMRGGLRGQMAITTDTLKDRLAALETIRERFELAVYNGAEQGGAAVNYAAMMQCAEIIERLKMAGAGK